MRAELIIPLRDFMNQPLTTIVKQPMLTRKGAMRKGKTRHVRRIPTAATLTIIPSKPADVLIRGGRTAPIQRAAKEGAKAIKTTKMPL